MSPISYKTHTLAEPRSTGQGILEKARRAALTLLTCTVVWSCTAVNDRPTEESCSQLNDHVIELTLSTAQSSLEGASERSALLNQHREQLRENSSYVDLCTTNLSRNQVECQLAAQDLAAFRRCK